jgi:hypothetical protein
LFSYSYALFCFAQTAISNRFSLFHTLYAKHPGWVPRISKGAPVPRLVGVASAMKTQSLSFVVPSPRCSHLTAAGRRCRQLSADRQPGLCHHHRAVQKQKEAHDHSHALLSRSQGFQTAQGLNFALGNLYKLLAANRISARRAAVLAYINSLQLRTLPAIDADNDAGITDPTVPKPQEASDPDEEAILEPTAESEPEAETSQAEPTIAAKSDSPATNLESPETNLESPETNLESPETNLESPETNSDSPETNSEFPETNANPTAPSPSEPTAAADAPPPSKYRSYWDTIADRTKKPS